MSEVIDKLVEQFESKISSREGKKTVQSFIDDCRSVLTEHCKELESKKGKTTAKKVTKSDDEKKLDTWNRIWVSKQYGGKTSFPKDYDRIKEEAEQSGGKMTSFQILSRLRTELEEEEDQTRWTEWYKKVQKDNDHAPKDPPTNRKPKEEKKKPVAAKKTEKQKSAPAPAKKTPDSDKSDHDSDGDGDETY
jgi:hypothetical protein